MLKTAFILFLLNILTVNIVASGSIPKGCNMPDHPRILLSEYEERDILKNITSDSIWNGIHTDILTECDAIIELPLLERKQIGMRLLAVSREALRRIFFLSYGYRMSGEEKYLKRAEKEMLTVASFTDWNPSHFLDVAEMTMAVSIGYDWLYNHLPVSSRGIIEKAIVEKGLEASLNDKYNWFLDVEHNWNQVCNAGMIFGAFAVYENQPEYCQNMIERSVESIRKPMSEYAPDGAYPEGYAYWEYGTTFNVLLIDTLEKIYKNDFGLSRMKGFMDTATYFEHITAPSGKSFNYADCGTESGLKPSMFWFAQKQGNPSLLWIEKNFLEKEYKDNYLKNRFLPVALLWGAEIPHNKITPPANTVWSGGGINPVALMRTSWSNPNAIFVGLKGGTALSNHAHMDAGSFIMEADGIRWAMDFGSQDYESLESRKLRIWTNDQDSERWKVFRYTNYVHNTPTVNGKLHNVNGKAEIISCSGNDGFLSATTDLTSIFGSDLSSYKRGIAIVNNHYVVVRDEVKTLNNKEAILRWTMLTSADIIIGKNCAELQKDGKVLRLEVAGDIPVEMKTWGTQSTNDYDAPNPGTILVGFECIVSPDTEVGFEILLLPAGVNANHKTKSLKEWH